MTIQNSFFPERSDVGLSKKSSRRGGRSNLTTSTKKSGDWVSGFNINTTGDGKVYNCSTCGLEKSCRNPHMKRFGQGKRKILIIGSSPNKDGDTYNLPLSGPSYNFLKRQLGNLGINLDEDCVITNLITCFPGTDEKGNLKFLKKEQIQACRANWLKDIEEFQPQLILCLGDKPITEVLPKPKGCGFRGGFHAGMLHGLTIPSKQFNCWVSSLYHPDFFLKRKEDRRVPDDENLFLFDLASAVGYLERPLPNHLTEEGNVLLDTVDKAIAAIRSVQNIEKPVAYDYETTRLTPWEEGAKVVSIAFSSEIESGYFLPLNFVNPETRKPFFNSEEIKYITAVWQNFIRSTTPKVVQNLNMEGTWDRVYFQATTNRVLHDTMLGSHILQCQEHTNGLAFQVYLMTGHDYKSLVNTKNIMSSRLEDLFHYNTWDARYTLMAYYYQMPRLEREGKLSEFNRFFTLGAEVLVGLTVRGVPISEEELRKLEEVYGKEQIECVQFMRSLQGVIQYEQEKATQFNPESGPQIGAILRNYYKISPEIDSRIPSTKTGLLCTDKNAIPIILEVTDNKEVQQFLEKLLRYRKCTSLLERSANYRRNVDRNWRVHPTYYLLCDSYRSSSEEPNIQNVFKHDEELKIFRRCIVPSFGRILLEVDYSGLEVKVIAMASGDIVLITQIKEGFDPHRYWASKLFQKPESEINSTERYEAKNGFVFKSFYGGTPDAMPFYSDLFRTIPKQHFFDVQKEFWEMYRGVKEWQNQEIEKYRQLGYVQAKSGFHRPGPLNINKLYNTPIQGTGFHILLNSLIHLDHKDYQELEKAGFKSEPLFEIHDSLTFDTVPEEASQLVPFVTDCLTKKWHEWQRDVPVEVEWEIGIKNWYELKSLEFRNCPHCGNSHAPMSKSKTKLINNQTENYFQCGLCKKEEVIVI